MWMAVSYIFTLKVRCCVYIYHLIPSILTGYTGAIAKALVLKGQAELLLKRLNCKCKFSNPIIAGQ